MSAAVAFAAFMVAAFALALASEWREAGRAGEQPHGLAVAFAFAVLVLVLAAVLLSGPAAPPSW